MGVQKGSMAIYGDSLLDRDPELAALGARVAQVSDGQGSLAAIEGPAGAGKTVLLQAVLDRGRSAGMNVLHARGSALAQPLAYGVVRQLFAPLVGAGGTHWAELLQGAARLAGLAVEEVPPDTGLQPSHDRSGAVRHGLYWLTANLAARHPVLLAVDDAQWADPPTLGWLAFLGRRLEGLPVMIVVAFDPDEPDLSGELRDAATVRLPLSPLSVKATTTLVRKRLGKGAKPALCRSCHEATGGNPLLLDQLLGSIAATWRESGDVKVGNVATFGVPDLSQGIVERLLRLPPATAGILRAAAVLGDGAALEHLAALAGLEVGHAEAAVEAARAAGILAPGAPLSFAHPLAHLAVSATVPADAWELSHRRAARLLAADGAAVDRIALHLLETAPSEDPAVVRTLRTAARLAAARGAPGVAAHYLRRALDEPCSPDLRGPVLLNLGLSSLIAHQPDAPALLRRAVETAADPEHRAIAALRSARALGAAGLQAHAVAVCESALGVVGAGDPPTRRRLEAELIANGWANVSTLGLAHHRLAAQDRHPLTGTAADGLIEANRAFALTCRAHPPADALALVDRATAAGALGEQRSLVLNLILLVLIWNERLDQAQRLCDERIAGGQDQGTAHVVARFSAFRSAISYRRGTIREAEADARFACTHCQESGASSLIAWPLSSLVDALVAADELAAAEEALAVDPAGSGQSGELPEHFGNALLMQSRSQLRAAQGRIRDGIADALDAGARFERLGVRNPVVAEWRAHAAELLANLGDLVPARRLADEHLELASSSGAARALGAALRVAGVVAGGEQGRDLLEEAVGLLRPSEAKLELIRAQISLGTALHHTGEAREARDLLRTAMGGARRAGALALAQRARQELQATGARPRRLPATGFVALTGQELRVARIAAEGLSNSEIAQRLFVTEQQVVQDLDGAFEKLGIKARDGLATELEVATPMTDGKTAAGVSG